MKPSTFPPRITEADTAALHTAWAAVCAARSATFGYFNDCREKVEGRYTDCNDAMQAWSAHVTNVLFADADPAYNRLKDAEGITRIDFSDLLAVKAQLYPWLGCIGGWLSDAAPADEIQHKIQTAYADAVHPVINERLKRPVKRLVDGLAQAPFSASPQALPVGQWVCSYCPGQHGLFQVTRITHGGRRVFATDEKGETVRLVAGRGGGGTKPPSDGYRLVSPEWAVLYQQTEKKRRALRTEAGLLPK